MDFINTIKQSNKTFIIAEIGQNHQGDLDIAKQLINVAKESGADCVKFQKTYLEEKFTKAALNAPYQGYHSWGQTYGDHKKHLEFSRDEFKVLQAFSKSLDISFTASAMDEISLQFLIDLKVPFIKIGSGDSNNPFLIENAAKCGIPLVISTGMINFEGVKTIYNLVSKYHKDFALLHCVSSYPTPNHDINLRVIQKYQQEFPDIVIGYSGHELGITATLGAVSLNAKIIERHITFDKTQKGSDHHCSLDPSELKALINQIRELEVVLGSPEKGFQPSERSCYEKLGKTLVYSKSKLIGDEISIGDLKVKVSISKGIDPMKYSEVLGKVLMKNVQTDEPVLSNQFNILE